MRSIWHDHWDDSVSRPLAQSNLVLIPDSSDDFIALKKIPSWPAKELHGNNALAGIECGFQGSITVGELSVIVCAVMGLNFNITLDDLATSIER